MSDESIKLISTWIDEGATLDGQSESQPIRRTSLLAWAATAQSAAASASMMLFFGLGTLPAMLATSLGADRLQAFLALQFPRQRGQAVVHPSSLPPAEGGAGPAPASLACAA